MDPSKIQGPAEMGAARQRSAHLGRSLLRVQKAIEQKKIELGTTNRLIAYPVQFFGRYLRARFNFSARTGPGRQHPPHPFQ